MLDTINITKHYNTKLMSLTSKAKDYTNTRYLLNTIVNELPRVK